MKHPIFIFAHGAGAPSSHPWMERWAALLSAIGDVHTFDYPYMVEGRRRPDTLPKLIAAHRAALRRARTAHDGPVVLIGKSMGSRVGCHLALEEEVAAVVCLSYPLCGAGDCSKLRDQVLFALRTPILFVEGTRDSLCPLDLLENIRRQMTAVNDLHIVKGGDHLLLVTKTQLRADKQTQEDVDQRILGGIRNFIARRG